MEDILLKVNGVFFDPDIRSKYTRGIQKTIHARYWKNISRLYLEVCTLVVRLGGLHNDIDEIKKSLGEKIYGRNIIFHFHRWDVADEEGVYDEDTFALIECDRRLFKTLFDAFWFSLGAEQHFQGIVIAPEKVPYLYRWSMRTPNQRAYDDLIRMSSVFFDNMVNGFHYRFIRKM